MAAKCEGRIFKGEKLLLIRLYCVSAVPGSQIGEATCCAQWLLMPRFFMGNAEELQEGKGLDRESSVQALRDWMREQGRRKSTVSRVIDLLQAQRLQLEPRPKTWNRRGQFSKEERNRYL